MVFWRVMPVFYLVIWEVVLWCLRAAWLWASNKSLSLTLDLVSFCQLSTSQIYVINVIRSDALSNSWRFSYEIDAKEEVLEVFSTFRYFGKGSALGWLEFALKGKFDVPLAVTRM